MKGDHPRQIEKVTVRRKSKHQGNRQKDKDDDDDDDDGSNEGRREECVKRMQRIDGEIRDRDEKTKRKGKRKGESDQRR